MIVVGNMPNADTIASEWFSFGEVPQTDVRLGDLPEGRYVLGADEHPILVDATEADFDRTNQPPEG